MKNKNKIMLVLCFISLTLLKGSNALFTDYYFTGIFTATYDGNSMTLPLVCNIPVDANGKLYYDNANLMVTNVYSETINGVVWNDDYGIGLTPITFKTYVNPTIEFNGVEYEVEEITVSNDSFIKWYSKVNSLSIGEYCLILVLVICAINLFIK